MDMLTIPLKDDGHRRSAIADHERSLLIEAGAGSGKTAVMAGRVAMLLARGVAPKAIAAVTFTELAASELLARVRDFVSELLAGDVPPELKISLPDGLSAAERVSLETAAESIDEIACTTIHGFCQHLIKPYPVEADIDPGAAVADKGRGDLIFREVVDDWLREKLSQVEESLLSELVIEDAETAMDAVETILDCMRKHRDLGAPEGWPLAPLGEAYASAVRAFHDFVTGGKIREPESIEFAGHFKSHIDGFPQAPFDDPDTLVQLLTRKLDGALFTTTGGFYTFRKKGKWETAGKPVGVPKAQAGLLHDEAADLYTRCCVIWTRLAGAIGASALGRLVEELKPAIERFQAHKREVGLLDFDDLIHAAVELLRNRDEVRKALAKRYERVLVDEFQDTDPTQSEIFWRLCGDPLPGEDPSDWRRFAIRPGALFVVGDPKQAIYRFRGADVAAYVDARAAFIAVEATGLISTNFRSRPKILSFVNERFAAALSAPEQPGFTELDPFHANRDGHCGVFALEVNVGGLDGKPNAEVRRDAEADAVAEMCERMIGRVEVYDHKTKGLRPCRAGDIALLAPTGTNLWRYEAALEDRGIAVSTQAGKGLFKRQEIQDLIALTRVLADGRDTLALGSLLRGPLVGLTEEQLLDIVWALPRSESAPESIPRLNLAIDPDAIADPYARDIFRKLHHLRSLSNSTTPHNLLSQALDMLNIRAMLVRRLSRQAERALANVDLYLNMSKGYAVRGLRAFAEAMTSSWAEARKEHGKSIEGRVDIQEQAVALYTMHASKGLEWPIVVPINTMGPPFPIKPEIIDRANRRLYVPLFGVEPEGYDNAQASEKAEVARERVRLWYVATTRAREMLVLPRPSVPIARNAWGAIVDLQVDTLPAIEMPEIGEVTGVSIAATLNEQTQAIFEAEAANVVAAHRSLKWKSPSRDEGPATAAPEDTTPILMPSDDEESELDVLPTSVQGGRNRGLVMHKLFEEVLNGEISDGVEALTARASQLIMELGQDVAASAAAGLEPGEIAACVVKALALPEIVALRPSLVPEMTVFACEMIDGVETATGGVADAIGYDAGGSPLIIIDWKSDVEPENKVIEHYREQVGSYLAATGAKAGLIVFATSGAMIRVTTPAN
jgi:ATP-dependent exoDNAse (exonuclease V) beta subunit